MISSQVFYCSSLVLFFQGEAEHFQQPNTVANNTRANHLFKSSGITYALYIISIAYLHWLYAFKMWAVGE